MTNMKYNYFEAETNKLTTLQHILLQRALYLIVLTHFKVLILVLTRWKTKFSTTSNFSHSYLLYVFPLLLVSHHEKNNDDE